MAARIVRRHPFVLDYENGRKRLDVVRLRQQPFVSKFENNQRRVDLIELEQISTAVGTTLLAVAEEFETGALPVPLVAGT